CLLCFLRCFCCRLFCFLCLLRPGRFLRLLCFRRLLCFPGFPRLHGDLSGGHHLFFFLYFHFPFIQHLGLFSRALFRCAPAACKRQHQGNSQAECCIYCFLFHNPPFPYGKSPILQLNDCKVFRPMQFSRYTA